MLSRSFPGPGNLVLTLDPREINKKDPGLGTPAMVGILDRRSQSYYYGTYGAATETGLLLGDDGDEYKLKNTQLEWLINEGDDLIAKYLSPFGY